MYKLVKAINMPYDYVLDYYYSYDKTLRYNEITSWSLLNAKNYDDYMTSILVFEKNLFYLIDETNPTYILGHGVLNVRSKNKFEKNSYAEVAYGVRSNERKKGLGHEILNLLIDEADKINLKELNISCVEDNISSKSIIEDFNSTFVGKSIDIETQKTKLNYNLQLQGKILQKKKH